MLRIDSHQHFWHFDPVRDSWITDDMKKIRSNFLPGDLLPELESNGFEGCIAVQANQSETETMFLAQLANDYTFIKGVVGWVDLQALNIMERLDFFSSFAAIKGFRHVLQGEPQRDCMLKPAFMNGISALKKFGFTYDILIFPDQINFSKELVAAFPEQKFVIDHMGKPAIKSGEISEWKKDIQQIASYPNVQCKISGMVTEADWHNWTARDFMPYLDTVVNAFGTSRIMFGSDWPVCNVAATYTQVVEITSDYFASFSSFEKERIFGQNAIEFYNIQTEDK